MVDRVEVQPDAPKEGAMDTPDLDQTMGKFKDDYDNLSKSYKSLQAEFTRKSQELAELKKAAGYKPAAETEWSTEGEAKAEEAAPQGESEEKPAEEQEAKPEGELPVLPGFEQSELEEMSQYAWDHRELTDDMYEKLEAKGYSRQLVDEYMEGQFARADGAAEALYAAGGGEAQVNAMFQWARDNLSNEEIAKYDAGFDQGGASAMLAMENLKSKYEASGEAVGGKTVTGANAPKGDTDTFKSTAQVVEAMSDPRYDSDPAYQRKVQEKLARSKVL